MPGPYIWEQPRSRDFHISRTDAGLTLSFTVVEAVHEFQVQALATSLAPLVYDGLIRDRLSVTSEPGNLWRANWEYKPLDPQQGYDPGDVGNPGGTIGPAPAPGVTDPLTSAFSGSIGGGTAHITQSRSTLETSPGAPGNHQAIGLTKDRVEGVDVVVPGMTMQRTVVRYPVTLNYIRTLFNLTGTVNDNTTFWGFNRGELLYLGADWDIGTGGLGTFTHKFTFSPTEFFVDVGVEDAAGNPVLVPFKRGWEYVWVSYKEAKEGNTLLQKPDHWYRELIYRLEDWTALEIGV